MQEEYTNLHINFGVSIVDVLSHPLFEDCDSISPQLQDERLLQRALFDFGIDTSLPIEDKVILHRTLKGDLVRTIMFRGKERTDDAWIRSGNASDVAKDGARARQKEKRRKLELDKRV